MVQVFYYLVPEGLVDVPPQCVPTWCLNMGMNLSFFLFVIFNFDFASWGFEKSYDFVYSKKPDIELNRFVFDFLPFFLSCFLAPFLIFYFPFLLSSLLSFWYDSGFVEQLFTLDKKLRQKRYQVILFLILLFSMLFNNSSC